MKIKVKRADVEWEDFMLLEHLKSLIYAERSLSCDSNKDKYIDELNLKNCVQLKRKTTSKLFVCIIKKLLFFILNVFIPGKNSHIHLFRISNINQTWFRNCQDK